MSQPLRSARAPMPNLSAMEAFRRCSTAASGNNSIGLPSHNASAAS